MTVWMVVTALFYGIHTQPTIYVAREATIKECLTMQRITNGVGPKGWMLTHCYAMQEMPTP
jgi:hypothetical protein